MHPNISILNVKINVFPLILMVAFFSCIVLFIKSKKYNLFYFNEIRKSMLYILVGAGIFGKALYIMTRLHEYNLSLWERLDGFVYYGGFIGAIGGLWIYCKKNKGKFLDYLDTYISILPLGQAIGRIGCYFNGCCYGKKYGGIFAVIYIVNGEKTKVFPTWFIESAFCLTIFIVFFIVSKKKFSGFYASIYMILYSSFRFYIEYYRGDLIRGIWNGISTSQFISIAIFVCGIVLLLYSIRGKEKNLIIIGRNRNYAN